MAEDDEDDRADGDAEPEGREADQQRCGHGDIPGHRWRGDDEGEQEGDAGVGDAEAAKELVAAAHQVCPYSNATRGNVDVVLTANGQAVD